VALGSGVSAQELPTIGHSDSSNGMNYGAGSDKCSVLNRDDSIGYMALSWLEGYVTAAQPLLRLVTLLEDAQNHAGAIVSWPVVNPDDMRTWERTYCQQHPDAMVLDVADALVWQQLFFKAQYAPAPEPQKPATGRSPR
jgi:hypothetical protein